MGKSPCCEKSGLKKGPWTPEEDQKLLAYIEQHGHGSWRALPAKAGLQRCGKSCRLRWTNYLRPDIKRGKFSLQEEQTIIQLHALLGNRWSAIATHLPKRTDNEIKNYWNTHLKKRLTKMGIDPVTHKPKTDGQGCGRSKDVANLSHMAQWESARLEAEARLARESKHLQGSHATLLLTTNRHHHQQQQAGEASRFITTNKISTLCQQSAGVPPCLDVIKAWQGSWSSTHCFTKNNGMGVNGIYSMMFATDDLQSPTSTLSFSDNMLAVPSGNVNLPLINQGSLFPSSSTINTITTSANVVSVEGAARGNTGNGRDGIIQECCDDQQHHTESWSIKPNINNDNIDAVIVESNDLINMRAYSVHDSSWFVGATVNETTVAVDDRDGNNVSSTDFQIDTIEPASGAGEILHHFGNSDDHDDIMVYNEDNYGNDQESLGNSNVNCYWNSILHNLVNASSSSVI